VAGFQLKGLLESRVLHTMAFGDNSSHQSLPHDGSELLNGVSKGTETPEVDVHHTS
jgi:hypothetical protein